MSMGDRGWRDSTENYCDGYTLDVNGSTATAVQGNTYKQPAAIFGISVTLNTSIGSGEVAINDSSATGDADPEVWSIAIASGTVPYTYTAMFPRGLACNNGIVVTATTVTGDVVLLYKSRYS